MFKVEGEEIKYEPFSEEEDDNDFKVAKYSNFSSDHKNNIFASEYRRIMW